MHGENSTQIGFSPTVAKLLQFEQLGTYDNELYCLLFQFSLDPIFAKISSLCHCRLLQSAFISFGPISLVMERFLKKILDPGLYCAASSHNRLIFCPILMKEIKLPMLLKPKVATKYIAQAEYIPNLHLGIVRT